MHFQVHHGSAEKSLLLFIMYSVVNADDEKCPNGWTHFGVMCCIRTCQTYDANLASVHNKLENDLLLSLVPSSTRFWVGAQDGEQVSLLTDGSPFNYTSGCSGEPNNSGNTENCLELAYTNRCWNNLTCSVQLAFVCAKNL
uniref:C-type lectin domain-containing protein n=1 Tax=Sinocyclocheilus rhinocerous TaxID=307959 RepID=A0A673G264_9TELE